MYLALESGLPRFPLDFSCPAVLRYSRHRSACMYGTITRSGGPSQTLPLQPCNFIKNPTTPVIDWFRLVRVRSPLLTEFFLFLGLLRCFSSPGVPSLSGSYDLTRRGFPHSDISDSCACTRLIGTFRSVPRPSSALDAKASPACSYSLLNM